MIESYVLAFGPFKLSFPQRTLSRNAEEVRLGSRAIDILIVLVQADGELVSNRDLVALVWPKNVVDGGSLRVHMSTLRKALDEGPDGVRYIANETGRGYRLAVPVEKRLTEPQMPSNHSSGGNTGQTHLPGLLGRILGREAVINGLCDQLPHHRLMTIAGAGGIGKTTVALGIAHRFESEKSIPVYFVDFAPVTDPSRVASTVALALGVPVSRGDPIPDLMAAIGQQPLLMVLDNCEHLVDAVALLVDRLLRGARGLKCLVTSREPLRTEGEWVHRLAPLQVPDERLALDAIQGLAFPSIALFVERACAANHAFEFVDSQVLAVREICRHLDGIPLAIEMAAARVASMDVQTLSSHLVDRFSLLNRGRRTALPRQQTLRAMLDWSYTLLDPVTQTILQRLSLFRSAFDSAAAVAVAGCKEIDAMAVLDGTQDLVAKSLLVSDQEGSTTTYRLLETTRHYALGKLSETDTQEAVRRAHVRYCCGLFSNSAAAWQGDSHRESTGVQSQHLDDVRAAFEWAASPDGDPALAIRLATVSSPLWFQLSLPYEFLQVAERAIAAIERANLTGSVEQAALLTAYGHAIWHTTGPVQAMADAFEASLNVAKMLGDVDIELRSLCGLSSQQLQSGEYERSFAIAEMYRDVAEQSPLFTTLQTSRHLLGLSHERLGHLPIARKFVEDLLGADQRDPVRHGHANAALVDGRAAGRTLLMRILWLQGHESQALSLARTTVDELLVIRHDLSLCFCLAMGALPVALWARDLKFAHDALMLLRSRTKKNGLLFWDKWADGFDSVIHAIPFDTQGAMAYQMEVFATLGCPNSIAALAHMGRSNRRTWCQAELLRREAAVPALDDAAREALLEHAVAVAAAQGATAWRLRAAADLARIKHQTGDFAEANALMSHLREAD